MNNNLKPQVGDIIGGKRSSLYFLVLIIQSDNISEWYLCLNLMTGKHEILGYFGEFSNTAWELLA